MDFSLPLALTLWTADFAQTRYIASHEPQYYELDGAPGHSMGKYPSGGRVSTYFIVGGALITTAYYELPKPWNKVAMYVVIGKETVNITHNAHIGIKFQF
jgi:hypothetical protein